jgi:superfamily I DNA/RNA helicase
LKSWLSGTGGITKRQVAILCPASIAQSSLRQLAALGGVDFTDNLDDWRADKAVLLTTLRKFKGLEADAVILFDVPEFGEAMQESDFNHRHFYVACSRAKHLLCVITKSERLLSHLQSI